MFAAKLLMHLFFAGMMAQVGTRWIVCQPRFPTAPLLILLLIFFNFSFLFVNQLPFQGRTCGYFSLWTYHLSLPWGYHTARCIKRLHMTSRLSYWCSKTIKRRPCSFSNPILWELNSFLMRTLSFVILMNLLRWWPSDWKRSKVISLSVITRTKSIIDIPRQTLQTI